MGNLIKFNSLNLKSFSFFFIWLKSVVSILSFNFFSSSKIENLKSNRITKLNIFYYKFFKNKMLFLNNSFFFNFLNFIFFKIFFSSHKIQNYINNKNYFNYKLYQTNWEFYKTNKNNSKNLSSFFFSNSFSFISGFKYFWSLIRFWVLGIVLFIFSFCYLTYIRLLPLNKLIFEWFLIVMFLYWLLSGFVFFF